VKFVPSLIAMDPISFAASFYPGTVLVFNIAVAIMLLMRRRALAKGWRPTRRQGLTTA
jgi:hypothetical protein